jgi:hypothetical protein
VCAALLKLRWRWPAQRPGFHLAGGLAIAPLGVLFCVWLLSTRTFAQGWVLLAIMAVGALLWWVVRRLNRAPGGETMTPP